MAATDAQMLTVTPYDKSSISTIEKAVMESDLGLTPSNDGSVIGCNPRADRGAAQGAGEGRPRGRRGGRGRGAQHRRDVMQDLRELKKEGEAGSDEGTTARRSFKKQTDAAIGEIDSLLKGKEEEILEV